MGARELPPGDQARRLQREASAPGRPALVRAGAGSGKTRVLVDRFLRLCVECRLRRVDGAAAEAGGPDEGGDGQDWSGIAPVHPRSILAITFTRKAAVEIQARLLEAAAKLATMSPDDLRDALTDLFAGEGVPPPDDQEMRLAADLYEKFLENPAGLQVGTIHSFCQAILSRFAAEAGLDPRFTVLEDPQELIDEALDALQQQLAADPQGAAQALPAGKDPAAVRRAVRAIFAEQMRLERWLDRLRGDGAPPDPDGGEGEGADPLAAGPGTRGAREDLLPRMLAELRSILLPEFPADAEPAQSDLLPPLAGALEEFAGAGLDGVVADLGAGGAALVAKDVAALREKATAAAQILRRAAAAAAADGDAEQGVGPDPAAEARMVLLTQGGAARAFTRMRKGPQTKERFQALVWQAGAPVLKALAMGDRLELYRRNAALLRLGLRALDLYDGLKRRDRVADFQDLEDMARRLMGDRERALSLLWRLDDSLTHILVDEFQDTNSNQYEILRPLIAEFLGGGWGQDARPTVFFVGDVKQSIYGFRGAEPEIFAARAQDLIALRDAMGEDEPARPVVLTLPTNFRSLRAVVQGVGELFTRTPLAEAMSPACRQDVAQGWVRDEAPGQVWLIPPYPGTPGDAAQEDAGGGAGDLAAAAAAAALVLDLKTRGEATWEERDGRPCPRPLAWKDFLVLLRTRTAAGLYEEAFRRAGIPIVPAGRGMLAASREVQDVLALLRWLQWPQDDVALATVLRSPLFRLDEERFQQVLAAAAAQPAATSGGLWEVLQKQTQDADLAEAALLLRRWRRRAGYEDCHDLLRRIYREGEILARYRLSARGDQAVYNLGRLFDVALGAEAAATPTLQRLAEVIHQAQLHGGQEEGVMPADQGEGRVRFMTVHGAKGLEAPVVLLVDADRAATREDAALRLDPGSASGPLLPASAKADRRGLPPPAAQAADDDPVQAAARRAALRDRAERTNLLYVAMTRARDRLFVLGGECARAGDDPDTPLRHLLKAAAGVQVPGLTALAQPWLPPAPPVQAQAEPAAAAPQAAGLQRHLWEPPAQGRRLRILTPSTEHAAPAATEPDAAEDRSGGREHAAAAAARRPARSAAIEHGVLVHALLQAAGACGRLPEGRGPAWQEAAAILQDPQLAWIFHPDREAGSALSEAAVIARRPQPAAGRAPELITGVIDRLVLRPGRADIIDFKTNRGVADPHLRERLVRQYRPQLDLYREAVALIYPERAVRAWLLFTEPGLSAQARLVPLD